MTKKRGFLCGLGVVPSMSTQPDIDICTSCGEHAEFNEEGKSECCGSAPQDTDPDLDMER